ncbi:hypothetical protein FRC14_002271 [Serendipita sp. 396]|nr:hypothetical protein FRC14_002271 [Serendipita sp. 396]
MSMRRSRVEGGRADIFLATETLSSAALLQRARRIPEGDDRSKAVISLKQKELLTSNTSSKAIVLRNGRHGVWGEGQVATFQKLSGQEKLALKADEIRRTAVSPPLRLDDLQRLAEAEMARALDLISDLHDPELFYDEINGFISSRPRLKPDLLTAPFVAKTIASRIHNAYLLAASWKVVVNVLTDLRSNGLTDSNPRGHLKQNASARDAYLLIVDTIEMLSNLAMHDLSVAAVASNEFGDLFTGGRSNKTFAAINPASINTAHQSFIDAILLELVLPNSRYEAYVLVAALRDALETTPGEESRKFSQRVFDALGNLVTLVDAKNMLLNPLYGEEGAHWLNSPRAEAAVEIDEFFDAIAQSLKASGLYSRWQSCAFPLRKLKDASHLDELWKRINQLYVEETGHSVDVLWKLEYERSTKPTYAIWRIPELAAYASDISSEDESLALRDEQRDRLSLVPLRRRSGDIIKTRFRKTTSRHIDEEDDDMPALVSVSGSSDDGEATDSSLELSDGEGGGVESEWEKDEKQEMDRMLNEAIGEYRKRNGKLPLWTTHCDDLGGQDSISGNLRSNPFLKMLRTLTGRMFVPDPTFRPNRMGEKPVYGPPRPPPEATEALPPVSTEMKVEKGVSSNKRKPTVQVEETEDEDKVSLKPKRKKKKKKPKKKTVDQQNVPTSPSSKLSEVPKALPDLSTRDTSYSSPPTNSQGIQATTGPQVDLGTSTSPFPLGSTSAQSAHSYLSHEKQIKEKIKTRGDPTVEHHEKGGYKSKGFFSKFGGGKVKEAKKEIPDSKGPQTSLEKVERRGKRGVLSLPQKASALIGRLLGSEEDEGKGRASMRWDQFVKAMTLMGFHVDNSSKGSRVTFHPPDKNSPSLVIHRPHPDPTINPVMLKRIGKRLKEHYGWAVSDFEHMEKLTGIAFDDDLD